MAKLETTAVLSAVHDADDNARITITDDGVTVGAGIALGLPSTTTVERDALSASAGFLIWNSNNNRAEQYNGSTWSGVVPALSTVLGIGNTTGGADISVTSGDSIIGAVELTLSASGVMDLDAAGALSLNSSAGAINIGNDDIDQAINIGTQGERTISVGTGAFAQTIIVGNNTGSTSLALEAGSGGLGIDADGNSVWAIAGTLDVDATGAFSINSSGGVINIGNDDIDQAINIGTQGERPINIATGAFADTVIIGNTTAGTTVEIKVPGSGDNFTVTGDAVVTGNLTVQGTTTTIEAESIQIQDNYIYTNDGYETAVAQTGGIAVNYLPTGTNDSVDTGGFTAGVPAVSNPTVITVGSGTFSAGDIIQVHSANNSDNDGIFEVYSHSGTTLTIKGIGQFGAVEDFTKNQFVTDATVQGTIRKVTVSVMRAGTDGVWETSSGSTTPFTFGDMALVSDITLDQAYGNGNTITMTDADGNFDVSVTSGTPAISLDAAGASNFTVDGASLTLSTTTSGQLDVSGAGVVNIDAVGALNLNSSGAAINLGNDAIAQAINIGTGAAVRTVSCGNSTGATTLDFDAGTGGISLDSTGAISLDGVGVSNFTADTGNLTLSTTTSGSLILNGVALVDIDAGANFDIDVTGTFDMLSTGAFSVDGTGASNVSADTGDLTLSTITSGSLLLTAAGALTVNAEANSTVNVAGDWTLLLDETQTADSGTAGNAYAVTSGTGAAAGGTTAGGVGGSLTISAGDGGAGSATQLGGVGGDALIQGGDQGATGGAGVGNWGRVGFKSGNRTYYLTAAATTQAAALTTTAQTIIEAINEVDVAASTPALSAVLGVGNTTGGTNLIFTAGDVIEPPVLSSDVAPTDLSMRAQNAYSQAATNRIGADLILAGGIGQTQIDIDVDLNGAGAQVYVTVNGNTTTLTEGSEFVRGANETETAGNLATVINGISGVSATSSTTFCYLTADPETWNLMLDTDTPSWATVSQAASGQVKIPQLVLCDYTAAQRDDVTALAGQMIWNTTTGGAEMYDGAAWEPIALGTALVGETTGASTYNTRLGSGSKIDGSGVRNVAIGALCIAADDPSAPTVNDVTLVGYGATSELNPGNFGYSEGVAVGSGTKVATRGVAIGKDATTQGGGHTSGVAVGYAANAKAQESIAIGASANIFHANNTYAIVIGASAATAASTSRSAIAIGYDAEAGQQQVHIGSNDSNASYRSRYYFFGRRPTHSSPDADVSIYSTGGSGTNIHASDLILNTGQSTGNAAPSVLKLQTTKTGASGSTLQTLVPRITLDENVTSFGGNYGESLNLKIASEELTGLSGASASTTNLVPAGARLRFVAAYVTTQITTADDTDWDLGDGTDVDRFLDGASFPATVGTTFDHTDATADPGGWSASTQDVTITAQGGSGFTAGAIRIFAFYEDLTAPTSG